MEGIVLDRRLLVFPNKDHLSIFLDVAASENLPDNWSVCPLFTLTVVNQIDKRYSVNKGELYYSSLQSVVHINWIHDFKWCARLISDFGI